MASKKTKVKSTYNKKNYKTLTIRFNKIETLAILAPLEIMAKNRNMSLNKFAKFMLDKIGAFEDYPVKEVQEAVNLELERQKVEREVNQLKKYGKYLQDNRGLITLN